MSSFTLLQTSSILLIVDMQEKIFASIERGPEILRTLCKLVQGFKILKIPILITEQYPEGLGPSIKPLQDGLGALYQPWVKSTFSCLDNAAFSFHALALPFTQWIVAGIEAHVCVIQTVKGLLSAGKEVAVLNDAIASRSMFDFSTAIAEMREAGARMTCSETILFELLKDSNHPHFKAISNLIKSPS